MKNLVKKLWGKKEYFVLSLIILLFGFVGYLSVISIQQLQGNTRVVNYIGIVRSATQKLVKEEIQGFTDNVLLDRIDTIVPELITGIGPNNLTVLQDEKYLQYMELVRTHWNRLKVEIAAVRAVRTSDPDDTAAVGIRETLYNSSQDFYSEVDTTVFLAEDFSDGQLARSMNILIIAAIVTFLVIVAGLVYVLRSMAIIKSTSKALKAERDEIAAMKDNLDVGLFLMNKDLIIQGAYSKALGKILAAGELQGKNLLDIISHSLKARERQIMKGYFGMIINHVHEQKMLEEINPIGELSYLQPETGEEKNLTCSFVPVEREEGEVFILGTIHDVTSEIKLKQQITEEVNKRQEEMRSLFEIIQLEPKVFNDFIEDTTDEFNRINDLLKDNKLPNQLAVVQIFQAVHAVKSNALILGLEDFSKKLHDLEGEINKLKEREEITFEEVLHITVELEEVMKEKDKFQATIKKIASFGGAERHGENRNQSEYVLIETLIKTSEKTSAALNKRVRFIVGEIDPDAIENGPRRAMKEVLMQLVRNAVYHGIETSKERLAAGKDETGIIKLSIKKEDGKIYIKLADDGRGLDFRRIRSMAASMQLIDDKDGIDHKHLVNILFSAGFSTLDKADLHAGRGVGLNLVRSRIQGVHGTINLNTNPGKGTSFTIVIPLAS